MHSWLKKYLFPHYSERQFKTVRYAFPLVVLTSLFLGLTALVSNTNSYISIKTTPSEIQAGGEISIQVSAYAHTPVNAVDIVLDYSESQLEIKGIDTGTSVITLWAEDPHAEKGKIYLRGGVFQKGFLGEHTIATIQARAKAAGIAQIRTENAQFVAGDGKGTEVHVGNSDSDETRIYITERAGEIAGKASVVLVTDVDGDGKVDLKDISVFMAAWFTKGKVFDFNNDGRMTFSDFSILLSDSFFK